MPKQKIVFYIPKMYLEEFLVPNPRLYLKAVITIDPDKKDKWIRLEAEIEVKEKCSAHINK